ncbi:uncharacterized protein TNCV_5038881 [Trichonephila clavipes]|nr:uncharacterized protein TNCV_5038881 [Trichonephila clavipes]
MKNYHRILLPLRFTKLAFNSNNTSASEAKLSTFDVPKPKFHGSTGNRIINFQALMGIISILCCPECYATGLKLAEDSKEGRCSNWCVAFSCGFMTGFTSTPQENKKISLNTLFIFKLRLIGRGFTAGSSGNMEAVGAFRIFERSLIKRDPQYTEYHGDGDSKGLLQVKDIHGIGIDPTTLENYMGINTERTQKLKRQSLPSTKLSR